MLLTPSASRLGSASGPLTIGYAVTMLLDRALVGTTGSTNWGGDGTGTGMGGGTRGGTGASTTAGMGWNPGVVALAVLMFMSGVITTNRRNADSGM